MSSGSASRGSSGCRSRATIVSALESWEEPAGGGAVAAAELVRLGAEVDFFVAVGNDEVGEQAHEALQELGCRVHAARRDEPQRLAFTYLDSEGERTITLVGPKLHPHGSDPLPWDELADIDAVYFTAGDADALRAARQARVLVATARELPTLVDAHVELDALVRSGVDPSEAYEPGLLEPEPKLIVSTLGREGGSFVAGAEEGRFAAARQPGDDRRCLRCGRFLRGGAHLRPRSWRRATWRARIRRRSAAQLR